MPTDPPAQPLAEAVVLVNHERDRDGSNITDLVEQPAKVMRIGSMIKQLLEELHSAPLHEAGRARLVGWLEGLFHGIQTTLLAQQMAARAQFEEMRRRAALASGDTTPAPDLPGGTATEAPSRTIHGPYL